MSNDVDLQVMVSSGRRDHERAALGVKMALAGASCGRSVRVFLVGDGGIWGCRSPLDHPEADVIDMLSQLTTLGAVVECCSVCAEQLCAGTGAMSEWGGLRDEVVPTGLVTFVDRATRGVVTLTF